MAIGATEAYKTVAADYRANREKARAFLDRIEGAIDESIAQGRAAVSVERHEVPTHDAPRIRVRVSLPFPPEDLKELFGYHPDASAELERRYAEKGWLSVHVSAADAEAALVLLEPPLTPDQE